VQASRSLADAWRTTAACKSPLNRTRRAYTTTTSDSALSMGSQVHWPP